MARQGVIASSSVDPCRQSQSSEIYPVRHTTDYEDKGVSGTGFRPESGGGEGNSGEIKGLTKTKGTE